MIKKVILLILITFLLHKGFLWSQPFGGPLDSVSFSTEVTDKNGKLLRLAITDDETYRVKLSLSEISPLLLNSTLLFEDRYFNYHFGVNPISLLRAAYTTYVQKKRVLGASTITMQLARKIYGVQSRSLLGKLEQIGRALQLEFLFSKQQILEAYLNLAPYGFNIEGVGAASQIYFNKPAERLTLLESLTLSVIPQSPYERTKHVRKEGIVNLELKKARGLLLSQWLKVFPENASQSEDFNLELQMRHPSALPFLAPHLTSRLLSSYRGQRVSTTIDLDIQQTFESIGKDYIARNTEKGLANLSALLVDTHSMEAIAYLGSVDFFNNDILGQVDGVKARRSPGSALKPFAYGLAIEQGLIHPRSMIKDAPTPFGTYTPENFDRKFTGPLSATEALFLSRNIPAIEVSRMLEDRTLYDFLGYVGIPLHPDPRHYGLSIVLGTAEVTMEELVSLYSVLNSKGLHRPVRLLSTDPTPEGASVMTPEASYLVLDMLAQNPPPDTGSEERWQLNQKTVSWKTGTSVGFRDAWSVGVFDRYVLAIWVGNFSGKGNQNFVGREAAGPLMFSMIDAFIKTKGIEVPTLAPDSDLKIREVEVCALSGQIPHEHCPHRVRTEFVPGISPIEKCRIHRKVRVDLVSGQQVCPEFSGITREVVLEYWPSDLMKLFKSAGIGRKSPPTLHQACKKDYHGSVAPQIVSPKQNITYYLRNTGSDSKRIPLTAIGDGNVKNLTWYINNELVGRSGISSPLVWTAVPGKHVARVVDDQGRSNDLSFEVQWID